MAELLTGSLVALFGVLLIMTYMKTGIRDFSGISLVAGSVSYFSAPTKRNVINRGDMVPYSSIRHPRATAKVLGFSDDSRRAILRVDAHPNGVTVQRSLVRISADISKADRKKAA